MTLVAEIYAIIAGSAVLFGAGVGVGMWLMAEFAKDENARTNRRSDPD